MMDYLHLYPKLREIAFQEDRKGTLKWGKVSGREATDLLIRLNLASSYDTAKQFLIDYRNKGGGQGLFIMRITRGGFTLEV